MEFEWDPVKNDANVARHGIDFADARLIFDLVVTRYSPRKGEDRYLALGKLGSYLVAVVYCDREGKRRLISARPAHTNERSLYDEIAHRLGAAGSPDSS